MHLPKVKAEALRLVAEGVNDCEISRRMGIPRGTVRDWRRPRYKRTARTIICPRCWRPSPPIAFSIADYAELLGLYLGDGCISSGARTQRLRISLDVKYPDIIADTSGIVERLLPENRVDTVDCGTYVVVSVYNRHLGCLFPQHAPGKKHERRIALEAWQLSAVLLEPWRFLRGCIRSDGCAFINRTGPYEYLSYDFSNRSHDIVRLVALACWRVGVRYRLVRDERRDLSDLRINRRKSVAAMVAHVGLKA